ncbi:hypothetical protein MRX96_023521 [Rhipicephalus microplus]
MSSECSGTSGWRPARTSDARTAAWIAVATSLGLAGTQGDTAAISQTMAQSKRHVLQEVARIKKRRVGRLLGSQQYPATWEDVLRNVMRAVNHELTIRGIKERVDLLIGLFPTAGHSEPEEVRHRRTIWRAGAVASRCIGLHERGRLCPQNRATEDDGQNNGK